MSAVLRIGRIKFGLSLFGLIHLRRGNSLSEIRYKTELLSSLQSCMQIRSKTWSFYWSRPM